MLKRKKHIMFIMRIYYPGGQFDLPYDPAQSTVTEAIRQFRQRWPDQPVQGNRSSNAHHNPIRDQGKQNWYARPLEQEGNLKMTDPTQLPLEALENIEAQSGIQLTELEFDRLKRNLACIDSLTEPDRSPEGQGHQLTQQCKEIAQLILDFETSDLT